MIVHYKDRDRDRVIAQISENVWQKTPETVSDKVHLLRKVGDTPGIQAEPWDKYVELVEDILIRTESRKEFRSSKENFENHKFVLDENDGMHGKQYFMSKKHWEIRDPRQLSFNY